MGTKHLKRPRERWKGNIRLVLNTLQSHQLLRILQPKCMLFGKKRACW